MLDLELGPMTAVGSDPARRRPLSFWVATVLALIVAAALLGAVRVYLDSRPGEVSPGVATVRAYAAAVSTGDAARLRQVLAPDVVWAAAGADRVGAGPYRGEEYLQFQTSLPEFRLELLGDPVASGDQVVVPTRIAARWPGVFGEGMSVFTLVTVGGTTMITEILWVPAPRYR
jgi:hypothetical protein